MVLGSARQRARLRAAAGRRTGRPAREARPAGRPAQEARPAGWPVPAEAQPAGQAGAAARPPPVGAAARPGPTRGRPAPTASRLPVPLPLRTRKTSRSTHASCGATWAPSPWRRLRLPSPPPYLSVNPVWHSAQGRRRQTPFAMTARVRATMALNCAFVATRAILKLSWEVAEPADPVADRLAAAGLGRGPAPPRWDPSGAESAEGSPRLSGRCPGSEAPATAPAGS